MTGHVYWRLDTLSAGASPPGGALSAAEWYLRQTIGGANEIPIASTQSTEFSSSYSAANLYDGNPATIWNSAGGDTGGTAYVAFQYSGAITPVQMTLQARADSGYQQQTPYTGGLSFSDTALTGPWTPYSSFSVSPFTTTGQIQTATFVAPPSNQVDVAAQSAFIAMVQGSGLDVSAQSAFIAMVQGSGLDVSAQSAFIAMFEAIVQVTAQSAFIAMFEAIVQVTAQSAMVNMLLPGANVADQAVFIAMFPNTEPVDSERRQYYVM